MKLPPAVKLLRSEVSPCGEVGKLNFTLREAQRFTMAQAITSHRHSRYFTKTSFCRFAFCGISCLIWRNCVPTDLNHLNAAGCVLRRIVYPQKGALTHHWKTSSVVRSLQLTSYNLQLVYSSSWTIAVFTCVALTGIFCIKTT